MTGDVLKVLSAGAVKSGVSKVAREFEKTTGTRVSIEFATAPEIPRVIRIGIKSPPLFFCIRSFLI